MEFHLLLCKLLSSYKDSLEKLKDLKSIKSHGDLDVILKALKKALGFRQYLRAMARSSAIEIHLQTIAALLVVDSRKSWTPDEMGDFMNFQCLKPHSIHKGKPLSPWESYINKLNEKIGCNLD